MSDMRNDLQDQDRDKGTTLQRDRTLRGEIDDTGTNKDTDTDDLNLDENDDANGDNL